MVNKDLRERLLKASTINTTAILTDSIIYKEKDCIPTFVPMMNVALSGTLDGGMIPGVTMIAGVSKNFKTGFGLMLASSFLKKYPEGLILFYDSEFGAPDSYLTSFGIPKDSIVHTPITNLEELRHDLITQLEGLKRDERVMIFLDSLGNVASKKEIDDAIEGKSVADMTRAKIIKSIFRIIGPHLTLKNIPMVCVNHTYSEQGMYPKEIVSGGRGPYYNANDIWILGRRQEKDETGVTGYDFVINIEKSRTVKEKSIIPISVSFKEGIYKWSGLFENAQEAGFIKQEKKGWFLTIDEYGEFKKNHRREELENDDDFWKTLITNQNFKFFIKNKYQLQGIMTNDC